MLNAWYQIRRVHWLVCRIFGRRRVHRFVRRVLVYGFGGVALLTLLQSYL